MRRRALLVGCNYPGSNAALNGCVNDVFAMRALLTDYFAFEDGEIEVMIDTDGSYTSPTGANVKTGLRRLVDGAEPGDVLVFHFSGHGTQVPARIPGEEEDGKDEAICPTDMNLLLDNDLKNIISSVPRGCNFTMVSDCCHSGGMLDHASVQISGDKQFDVSRGSESGFLNRSLDIETVAEILSLNSGEEVAPTSIHSVMGNMFGDDAGFLANYDFDDFGEHVMKYGCLGAIGGLVLALGLGAAAAAIGWNIQGQDDNQPTQEGRPAKRPPGGPTLDADVGVLITGCQSHETSADACPSGDPSRAYGALTNALTTVLQENPNATYREVVGRVRNHLAMHGYSQNPCLECSDYSADSRMFVSLDM